MDPTFSFVLTFHFGWMFLKVCKGTDGDNITAGPWYLFLFSGLLGGLGDTLGAGFYRLWAAVDAKETSSR